MHRMLVLSLVACAGSEPAARPHTPSPVPSPSVPLAAPTPPPPTQRFAVDEPGYAFAESDRKTKLAAAFPKIDVAIAEEMKLQNVLGLALGVVIDGELAYEKGYGVVDVDAKTVPDADTAYRIGSISKSFAALGVLALRDDGVLQLDDPLVRWIPEAAALIYPTHDARPITLRQLLTHTSGLVRAVDFKKTATEDVFLAQLHGLALENPPGQQFVYSNLGFALLGIVVARASHATLADAIAKRVFGPLGMTASAYDSTPKLAPAYEPDNKTRKTDIEHLAVAGGAGGVVSTVRDMARYVAFELSAYPPRSGDDRGPLHRATIREAHSTGFAVDAELQPHPNAKRGEPVYDLDAFSYGFGWEHHKTCQFDDLVEHGGAIDSHRASAQFLTQHGVGVVVLSNFGNANTFQFGKRVLDELRATEALKPYVAHPKLAPEYDATMTKFLAIYNEWNEDAFKALLSRPLDPREHDELAGYKKLHGACSAFTAKEIKTSHAATFTMTCEHGELEMSTDIAPDGRLGGFTGISHKVPVPADITRAANAWMSLMARWDDGLYARTFADPKQREDVKRGAQVIHTDVGTCKPREIVHEGTSWGFDTTCEHGKVHFYIELEGGKIKERSAQRLEGGGCPVK